MACRNSADTKRKLRKSAAQNRCRPVPDHSTFPLNGHGRFRQKVEMLFARLKRIPKSGRLRLRGPCGARDEFLLAAAAPNLRKLAKLRPPIARTPANA
jgi:hypothetical protein